MSEPSSQGPRQLPRGPHKLSRKTVTQVQRERLFLAVAQCAASKGYSQTSVADVLALSGVSRATFYQLFADKEDCFCAAYQHATRQLNTALMASQDASDMQPAGNPDAVLERLERLLGLYLVQLAGSPDSARAFMVEVHAAGSRASAQRQATIESFIDLVAATLAGQMGRLGPAEDQRFAVKLFVHGVISLATSGIAMGEASRLPELRAPLMRLAVKLIA